MTTSTCRRATHRMPTTHYSPLSSQQPRPRRQHRPHILARARRAPLHTDVGAAATRDVPAQGRSVATVRPNAITIHTAQGTAHTPVQLRRAARCTVMMFAVPGPARVHAHTMQATTAARGDTAQTTHKPHSKAHTKHAQTAHKPQNIQTNYSRKTCIRLAPGSSIALVHN